MGKGTWQSYLAHAAQIHSIGRHVPNLYNVAIPSIKAELLSALPRLANRQPTALVITGDISASPKAQQPAIDEFCQYVDDLISVLPAGSVLVPLLGNHDWHDSRGPRQTNFAGTLLDKAYDVRDERIEIFDSSDPNLLFFILDSCGVMVPATGEIKHSGFGLLAKGFAAGKGGHWGSIGIDYDRAFRMVLLHHSPVLQLTYDGLLTPWWYSQLELKNPDPLLDACKEDIDMFLFGHTHVPLPVAHDGFIMLDAGSAMALPPRTSLPACTIQVIRVSDDARLVTVETHSYSWTASDFLPAGSRSFAKGSASSSVRARARWS